MLKVLRAPFQSMSEEQEYQFAQEHGRTLGPITKRLSVVFTVALLSQAFVLLYLYGFVMFPLFAMMVVMLAIGAANLSIRGAIGATLLLGLVICLFEVEAVEHLTGRFDGAMRFAIVNMSCFFFSLSGLLLSRVLLCMSCYKGNNVQLTLPLRETPVA